MSLACLLPLALVPLVLWSALTAPVLSLISSDPALTGPGSLYAGVLASALPGRVLFSQLSQYLTAQGVMYPSSVSAAVALVSNLALGLFFILGLPIIPGEKEKVIPILLCSAGLTCLPLGFPHKLGFPAAAPTTVTSEYIQLAVLVLLG